MTIKREKTPTVAVLMSSYNGEKFIREQIESILCQKGVNVRLYVRDDGSTDSTVSILKEYQKQGKLRLLTDGRNLGAGESFMQMLYHCEATDAEFFSFADQDDIWLENKLLAAVKKINEYDPTETVLYCSNQYLLKNGENCGLRHKVIQDTSLIGHMTRNTVSGCTFVLNHALVNRINEAPHVSPDLLQYRIHDAWIFLAAIVCGVVVYDQGAYMLYRIHDSNTVGIKKETIVKRLLKLTRFFSTEQGDGNIRKKTAVQLLLSFPDMERGDKEIILKYANYNKNFRSKCRLFFDKNIRDNCGESIIVFAGKVFTGFI